MFERYVRGDNCVEIRAKDLELLRNPGVYLYLNDEDTAIYIGSSVSMLGRASSHKDKQELRASTKVLFIPCLSVDLARELESQLITDLRPLINKNNSVTDFARKTRLSPMSAPSYRKRLREAMDQA